MEPVVAANRGRLPTPDTLPRSVGFFGSLDPPSRGDYDDQ